MKLYGRVGVDIPQDYFTRRHKSSLLGRRRKKKRKSKGKVEAERIVGRD